MKKKEEIRKAIELLVSALKFNENYNIDSKIEYAIGWLTSAIITDVKNED